MLIIPFCAQVICQTRYCQMLCIEDGRILVEMID
jgi:hypothetical protein